MDKRCWSPGMISFGGSDLDFTLLYATLLLLFRR